MDSEAIRNLREELGVSQRELAHRLEVAPATVARWEEGTSVPDGKVLARLQRLSRFKEFQTEGRLITLAELMSGERFGSPGNQLPPWHQDSDSVEAGHLSLVVSPPKCGKTLTALRWAYRAAHHHEVPAFYVSTHWTPLQTLTHLEKGLDPGETLDPTVSFHLFQHDGKDLTGLLEELSARVMDSSGAIVVFDWLQNLDYAGENFPGIEERERQLLRDLKTWSTQQGAYVLVIASQRGVALCDNASFPHFFELADSISIGSVQHLKKRRAQYAYQDLHRGGATSFTVNLPPIEELPGQGGEPPARDRGLERFRVGTPGFRGD